MANIKGVLVKASSYSDGGVTKGMPPTQQDFLMRIKHTSDSVEYNLEHAEDHLAELVSQLSKLSEANHERANQYVDEVSKVLYKFCDQLKVYKVEM